MLNKTRRHSNCPYENKNRNRLTAGVARDGFAVAREGRAARGVAGAGLAGLGVLGVRAAELEHEPVCGGDRTNSRSVVWCGCRVVKSRDKYLSRREQTRGMGRIGAGRSPVDHAVEVDAVVEAGVREVDEVTGGDGQLVHVELRGERALWMERRGGGVSARAGGACNLAKAGRISAVALCYARGIGPWVMRGWVV